MTTRSILVIDDDPSVREVLEIRLRQAGHEVRCAADGSAGLEMAYNQCPDLIVLDVMLPRRDGLEVLRTLRRTVLTPVLMLTARTDLADRLAALEAGADDYITKPFSSRDVAARIESVMADIPCDRPLPAEIEFNGAWSFDLRNRWICRESRTVPLTRMEFKLLCLLALHPLRPYTRSELLHQVWGYRVTQYADVRVVDVHVARLRAKLGDDAAIRTHPGVGYLFALQSSSFELAGR